MSFTTELCFLGVFLVLCQGVFLSNPCLQRSEFHSHFLKFHLIGNPLIWSLYSLVSPTGRASFLSDISLTDDCLFLCHLWTLSLCWFDIFPILLLVCTQDSYSLPGALWSPGKNLLESWTGSNPQLFCSQLLRPRPTFPSLPGLE